MRKARWATFIARRDFPDVRLYVDRVITRRDRFEARFRGRLVGIFARPEYAAVRFDS